MYKNLMRVNLQITSPNPWCLQVCKAMFFFVNFVISQSGNDPREDLAKFGYQLNLKVELLNILFYF